MEMLPPVLNALTFLILSLKFWMSYFPWCLFIAVT